MEIEQYFKELDGVDVEPSTTCYLSPRVQKELDKATVELDAVVADFLGEGKFPKGSGGVSWGDIELGCDEDDSRPIKFRQTEKPKLTKPKVITLETHVAEVNASLEALQKSVTIQASLREAEKIEAKATSIDSYSFKKLEFNNSKLNEFFTIRKPKVTAVIDWLKLQMTVSPTYSFSHPSKKFQDVRKFLKLHGINNNARVDQSLTDERIFTFDMHDVASGEHFKRVIALLESEYGATNMKIVVLELSLDFWHVGAGPLLLALAKSVRADTTVSSKDFRIYRGKGQFRVMPKSPHTAMRYINEGYTIGVGHRDNDDVYIRLYFKTKDQNKNLPTEQHCMRVEVNLSGQLLADLGNDADNLKHLVNGGFGYLRFTKLNDGVTAAEARHYRERIELFGQEKQIISRSRNKRDLPDFIRTHAELNKTASKAVCNFSRNF